MAAMAKAAIEIVSRCCVYENIWPRMELPIRSLRCLSVVPYFIVGMTNSAPARMPVGQRAVTVLSLV